ncbi:MAG TPA: HAMP domain-containing sensor histidine kinase [Pirellulales bacterium]|nr:HAMP domain-containing sensor histidine kinase [Pirellulales bacterium]
MQTWLRTKSTADSSLAPALLLVLLVALPTAAMLWLMNEAMQNERLAVRPRLADAYRGQLEIVRQQVVAAWRRSLAEIDASAAGRPPAQAFAAGVGRGFADSVIVLDANGRPSYPADAVSLAGEITDASTEWQAAAQLEFTDRNYSAAAQAYGRIARAAQDERLTAQAIRAQARSLLAAGDRVAVVQLLNEQTKNPRIQATMGADGRWLLGDLMLLLVETARQTDPPLGAKTAGALSARIEDYDRPVLGSAQRRFIMHELSRLFPGRASFATLTAEDLAAEFREHSTDSAFPRDLQPAGLEGVWKVTSPGGRVLLLFRTPTLFSYFKRLLAEQSLLSGVRLEIAPPLDVDDKSNGLLSAAIGPDLPRWRISLTLLDDPFDGAASTRTQFYFWTALVTILATGSLALLVATVLRRQMRLSRLKNDLVATVSHELKTPLSSMRLLVDTLLERQPPDPRQTREYLQLAARENERLSRLIDNFLTFSRLERGKQRFAAEPVDPAEVARQAAEALHERLHEPNCQFELQIEPDLPMVTGDFDALVTVLVNLLDNALKYSGDQKRIVLRAIAKESQVAWSVEDNGVGLSPRHKRRVFDRFYQVNERLTRTAGGCGLGLSIARRIVIAHGGSIAVESEAGKGSAFLVTLPAIKRAEVRDDSCTTF